MELLTSNIFANWSWLWGLFALLSLILLSAVAVVITLASLGSFIALNECTCFFLVVVLQRFHVGRLTILNEKCQDSKALGSVTGVVYILSSYFQVSCRYLTILVLL